MNDAYGVRGFRVGAVIAVAVVAGFLIWLLVIRNDDSGSSSNSGSSATVATGISPTAANKSDLVALQSKVGHQVYWAGDISGKQIELTEATNGRIYVRYLSPKTNIGEQKPQLTIGTYPVKNAKDALQKVANNPGAIVADLPNGGLVVTNEGAPNDVYLAYPNQDVQVDVYDPNAQDALALAKSGNVVPVR